MAVIFLENATSYFRYHALVVAEGMSHRKGLRILYDRVCLKFDGIENNRQRVRVEDGFLAVIFLENAASYFRYHVSWVAGA